MQKLQKQFKRDGWFDSQLTQEFSTMYIDPYIHAFLRDISQLTFFCRTYIGDILSVSPSFWSWTVCLCPATLLQDEKNTAGECSVIYHQLCPIFIRNKMYTHVDPFLA